MEVSSLFSPLYWTGGGVCISSFYKYHRQKRKKEMELRKEEGKTEVLRDRGEADDGAAVVAPMPEVTWPVEAHRLLGVFCKTFREWYCKK